jgi:hypothetical protein
VVKFEINSEREEKGKIWKRNLSESDKYLIRENYLTLDEVLFSKAVLEGNVEEALNLYFNSDISKNTSGSKFDRLYLTTESINPEQDLFRKEYRTTFEQGDIKAALESFFSSPIFPGYYVMKTLHENYFSPNSSNAPEGMKHIVTILKKNYPEKASKLNAVKQRWGDPRKWHKAILDYARQRFGDFPFSDQEVKEAFKRSIPEIKCKLEPFCNDEKAYIKKCEGCIEDNDFFKLNLLYEFYSQKYDLPKERIEEKHDELIKKGDIERSVYLYEAVSIPPSDETIQRSCEQYLLEGRSLACFDLLCPFQKEINPDVKDRVLEHYKNNKKELEHVKSFFSLFEK